MVRYILNFLSKETKGVHQAAYLLAFFTLMSQLLGLVRDRLLASEFGAGQSLDVYYAAFRIPDLIFITVSSLVSVSVLVPFLIRLKESKGKEEQVFLNSVCTIFFITIVLVISVAYIFMPELLRIIVPGITDPALVPLARVLLLSPLILGISNICGSIIQARERFLAYALSPVLYNAGIVFGIIYLVPKYGLFGLAYGVITGSLLHVAIQLPSLFKEKAIPRLTFNISWPLMREVWSLSIPRTLTLASNHMVMVLLVALASFMTVGSISVFTFAFNLQSVPMGIIGVSYSLAAFPMLSRLFCEGKKEAFVREVLQPLSHVLFWSIPITVLFIVLRAQMVRTILGAGEFNWNDTRLTAAACALFVISVCAQNVALLLIRAHYARGNTQKPFLYAMYGALASIVVLVVGYLYLSNTYIWYFIESLFRVGGLRGTEVLLLPIAFSVGAILQSLLLWRSFEKEYKGFSNSLFRPICQSIGASFIGGYVSYIMLGILDNYFNLETTVGIFMQGFIAGIVGIIVMALILLLLGNQEIRVVLKTLHSKVWKAKPIAESTPEIV